MIEIAWIVTCDGDGCERLIFGREKRDLLKEIENQRWLRENGGRRHWCTECAVEQRKPPLRPDPKS